MRKIEKRVEIYVAKDGKEFLNMTDCIFYESHVMVPNQKKEWVKRYYSDFCNNRDKWIDNCKDLAEFGCKEHEYVSHYDTTICDDILMRQRDGRTIIINLRTGRCGKAIQSNPIFFKSETGWAVAWARYRGDEVPDYI